MMLTHQGTQVLGLQDQMIQGEQNLEAAEPGRHEGLWMF